MGQAGVLFPHPFPPSWRGYGGAGGCFAAELRHRGAWPAWQQDNVGFSCEYALVSQNIAQYPAQSSAVVIQA